MTNVYDKFCDVIFQAHNLIDDERSLLYVEEYALDDIESSELISTTLIDEQTWSSLI